MHFFQNIISFQRSFLLLVDLLFSHLSLIVVCSVVANDTDIGRGSSVASSRFIPFLDILLHFSVFSLLFYDSVFSFCLFYCVLCSLLYFFFPPFVLFHLSLFFLLFSSLLSQNSSCFSSSSLISSCFSELFLFFHLFFEPPRKTCHSFCLPLVSFLLFCVFLSFVSFVLPFFVYMLFVNIVFSESSSFKCVCLFLVVRLLVFGPFVLILFLV